MAFTTQELQTAKAIAAHHGKPEFLVKVGLIYSLGYDDVKPDPIEAIAWFALAADAGSKIGGSYKSELCLFEDTSGLQAALCRAREIRDNMPSVAFSAVKKSA